MKRAIGLLLLIGGIWIGFTMGQSIPYIDLKLRSKYWITPERALIETAQYPIWVDFVDAPDDPGSGGAMALWGEDLLLVTRPGGLYLMRADRSGFDRLDIPAPFDFDELQDLFSRASDRRASGAKGLELRRVSGGWELFIAHNNPHTDRQCSTLALSKVRLDGTGPGTRAAGAWETIYETKPCVSTDVETHLDQTGGILEFEPGGELLMTVGDFGIDGNWVEKETLWPTNPAVDYGKILSIDPDSGAGRILTSGHRNPEGITVAADGRIWSAEHGPAGGDELNLIVAGRNYGWPHVTYGSHYGAFFWPLSKTQARHDGFTLPIYSWVPSPAISALDEITGKEFPFWQGDLIVATLVGRNLIRLHLVDGPRVVVAEPIDLEARVRDVLVLPSGEIAAKLDSQPYVAILSNQVGDDLPAFVAPKALGACVTCHALGPQAPRGSAPDLWQVWGRQIGAAPGYEYSGALSGHGGVWDEAALRAFLSDAGGFAPGTPMPDPGLTGAELDAAINALEGLR